jgi:translocation and assembly module TamB
LDSEWRGNLHVGGTLDASQITGTLSPLRGQIDFLDRTFALQESSITLDGRTPPSPYLDLNAATRTADLTARLHLFGVYPDVKLELQSEPALPEDEILARLLFDRNLRDITPFQAVQLVAMLESIHGSDGLSALTRSSRMLGDFRIQVHRQGEGMGETSVSVGKYLNERIYVEVEQGLKDESGKGRVEYQVTPELSIEGRAGSEGKGAVGLFYKKDY